MLDVLAAVLALTALLAYANARWIRLPPAIGLLLTALLSAFGTKALAAAGVVNLEPVIRLLREIDFRATLLEGMLGPLLFAAALHVDVSRLRQQRLTVLLLATVGTLLSAALVAGGLYVVGPLAGLPVPWLWAVAFGVLIAPTDPIAVGALLKTAGVSKDLQTIITGESLFNDGSAVVAFLVVLTMITSGGSPDPAALGRLLLLEVGGGVAFGLALGWLAVRALRAVDDYQVEILVTLALVFTGFDVARHLHVSGVLGMVVMGLMLGHTGRATALSERTQQRLDEFWELVDEFLNAALFVLIGVEVLVLDFRASALWVGAAMIPVGLLARYASVAVPLLPVRGRLGLPAGSVRLLTWAGVRGGISIALALALPPGALRTTVLTVTYVVVCFSILAQGLTIRPVARRLLRPAGPT